MFLSYVLGAQKNRLIESVLLSTHNICFGLEIRKLVFCDTHITKSLTECSLLLQVELFLVQVDGLTDGYFNKPGSISTDVDVFGLL